MLQKPPCIPPMRAANFVHDMCVKSNCQTGERDKAACQVKRWEGVESKSGKKGEETKQTKLQTFQLSAVGLVCMCVFFFFLSLSHQDGRGGGGGGGQKVLIKMKDCNNSPTTPIVIISVPLPSVFLDVLTRRNDVMHRTV